MRPKVKFLTVVWGEVYITRFAELALPSFLAPGNLPALAAGSEFEVVIMTRGSDIGTFENSAAFRKLRGICDARFIAIDDLITTAAYGFTLTLAYARAVIACGRGMLETHFVFMNADFVLADGSLRSLLKHIRAGRSIVLAPSFRATAEAVESRLWDAVDASSGVLAMPPRQLAALSLAHPHPTTIAKTVGQGFCHSVQPNQFFWQVDEQTTLGRYYLIFMLCLKPERMVTHVNSFCDYAFIPEMCPSGDEAVMGDSDDFFMLELQHRDQEKFMLRIGRQTDQKIAASLESWTTAEHRRAAGYDIVFHAGDLPPALERAKAEARAFVDRIGGMLGPPVPHARHWHWFGVVAAFRRMRKAQGLPASPPELAPMPRIFLGRGFLRLIRDRVTGQLSSLVSGARRTFRYRVTEPLRSLIRGARRSVLGRAPLFTPFHPNWLDFLHLRNTLDAILAVPGARVLMVREQPELVDRLVGPGAPVRFATARDVQRGRLHPLRRKSGGFTHVLIYVLRKDLRQMRRLVAQCQPLAEGPGSACHVFIHHWQGETEDSNFSFELVNYLEAIAGWPRRATEFSFVGGSLKRFNRRLYTRLAGHYAHVGIPALLWVVPALAIAMPLVLLANLYLRRKLPSSRFVHYCSSMMFRAARAEAIRAASPAAQRRLNRRANLRP